MLSFDEKYQGSKSAFQVTKSTRKFAKSTDRRKIYDVNRQQNVNVKDSKGMYEKESDKKAHVILLHS